jgi:hypothetical protein
MPEYVYTTVPGKIKPLLAKVRQAGIPAKVNQVWIKSVGFTSSNDTSLIGVLKFVDLVDSSGVPTLRWNQFRGNDHKRVLGEAIKSGYADLFSVYSDADSRSQSEIEHVFRTSSSAGTQAIAKTLATFKALVEEAEFTGSSDRAEPAQVAVGPRLPLVASGHAHSGHLKGLSPASLHIDIQIHISPESTSEQIDQIFESMAKYLYNVER